MAIGPDQKVTTTGLMGGSPQMPKAPDMSGLGQGQAPAQVAEKSAPEISPLLDQAGSNEENVTLPISIVKQYAIKIYGGDEKTAIQNFITDLSGEQPDNNVPLDTAQASTDKGMLAQQPDTSETDAIDQGLV